MEKLLLLVIFGLCAVLAVASCNAVFSASPIWDPMERIALVGLGVITILGATVSGYGLVAKCRY